MTLVRSNGTPYTRREKGAERAVDARSCPRCSEPAHYTSETQIRDGWLRSHPDREPGDHPGPGEWEWLSSEDWKAWRCVNENCPSFALEIGR